MSQPSNKYNTACGHLRIGQARCGLCDKCLDDDCCKCTKEDRDAAYGLFKALLKERTGIDLTKKKDKKK